MKKCSEPFTRFPTNLLDALCRVRIAGAPRMILDTIIRQTIGWQKSEDWITLSQFQGHTGLPKNATCRAINHLIGMKIIHKKEKGEKTFYSVELKTACWIPLPKKRRGHKKANEDSHKSESVFTKKGHTIENVSTETDTKEKDIRADARTPTPNIEISDAMEQEYRTFLKGVSLILAKEKQFTKPGFTKYRARRKTYDLDRICRAFENLLNEPDRWKIENNAFRPMQWWLRNDDYIVELEHVHLKKVKGQSMQAVVI